MSRVVIAGISGRFPESQNIEEFKKNLFNGVDMVTEGLRWKSGLYDLPERMGKIKELNKFDATFFGVHAKQAHVMDPQLRMLLEVSFEAIIDAGVNPSSIRWSKTGVFIGASGSESKEFWTCKGDKINGYGLLGCQSSMLANRLSYAFDLRGPSVCTDSACSSSLQALEQAFTAIRTGACDSAIVGGVNVLLKPENSLQFHRLGMLSADGKCKSFDAAGDGYVRSEAVVAIYITKEESCIRSYAAILNAKTNTDGYKEQGITYPNGMMQRLLLEELYKEIGINPNLVSYIEAHGTGTKAGDPEELNNIAQVFCNDREANKPLLIGAVKSNMGHSEPASGLCSLVKICIAIREQQIPANLHYNEPNPNIPALFDGRIKVVNENLYWAGGLTGINSFGFGGVNVHVLLETNLKIKSSFFDRMATNPVLLCISGRTNEAVNIALDEFQKKPHDQELNALVHEIYKNDIHGHDFRGYTVLGGVGDKEINNSLELGTHKKSRPVWFVFSGMGSQWTGMGRDLLRLPAFEASIKRSSCVLGPLGVDLLECIKVGGDNLETTLAVTAIQIALLDILTIIGITPDGLVGHSFGELGCGYADGCMTAEETMQVAFARTKAIAESNLEEGAMAAVGLSWAETGSRCPQGIFLACHNAPDSVTISGPPKSIERFVAELVSEGIFARVIDSMGYGFHSPYIASAGSRVRKDLEKILIHPKSRTKRWISSSIPEHNWDSPIAKFCSAEYLYSNFINPVLFNEALLHLPEDAVVVEVSPHCILQSILRRSLPLSTISIGLIHKDVPDSLYHLLKSLGKLYLAGLNPDIGKLFPQVDFPVSVRTSSLSSFISKWDHSTNWKVARFDKYDEGLGGHVKMDVSLEFDSTNAYLLGHRIDGRALLPATKHIYMVWSIFARLRGTTIDRLPVIIQNLSIQRVTILERDGVTKFTISILLVTGQFEVVEGGQLVSSGFIRSSEDISSELSKIESLEIQNTNNPKYNVLNSSEVYKELNLRGYEYQGDFMIIKSAGNELKWAKLVWNKNWVTFLDGMLQLVVLGKPKRGLHLPTRIESIIIDPTVLFKIKGDDAIITWHENWGVVRGPGVELRGINCTTMSRRSERRVARHESYSFTPYFDYEKAAVDATMDTSSYALQTIIQLVIENIKPSRTFNFAEIVNSMDNSLARHVENIVLGEPESLIGDATLLINGLDGGQLVSRDNQKEASIKMIPRENGEKPFPDSISESQLIILDDELHMGDLCQITKENLSVGHFVLFQRPKKNTESSETLKNWSKYYNLISHKFSDKKDYILFRRKIEAYKNFEIIQMDNQENYQWFEHLKSSLSQGGNSSVIYLVSKGDPTSGIIGLINCLLLEAGSHKLRCIFTPDNSAIVDLNLSNTCPNLKRIFQHDLVMNVFKNGVWGSFRHFYTTTEAKIETEHAYANIGLRGDLTTLSWIKAPIENYLLIQKSTPKKKELCAVHYASLNFRDIMIATGKLPLDALPGSIASEECLLGLEFSGETRSGRRVMGMVQVGGMATTILADPSFLWEVPNEWSLEEAASIPVAYSTAYYALLIRGQLVPGQSVLIHSGTGGVGQAAITVAFSLGCRVFTTVGSNEKRNWLLQRFPQLVDEHVGSSRDTSFEGMVLQLTRGRGVDVVLNSLAGKLQEASIRCLAHHGQFLEIGKTDLIRDAPLRMSLFLKNISFQGILLDAIFCEEAAEVRRRLVTIVAGGIIRGIVKPLPRTVFSHHELEQAFRYMSSGRHIGKVVLKIRVEQLGAVCRVLATPRVYFSPVKCYVLVGGLGGFGLEMAGWMVERGARRLALLSRSGLTTGYQTLCLRRWAALGARVETPIAELTSLTKTESLIKKLAKEVGPIGGIFNLAAVLSVGLVQDQNEQSFRKAVYPKIMVTLHLDLTSRKLCTDLLDYFVVFSSFASGRGLVGQCNYGFANSGMERICERRAADGLPGLAIQWGAIGDVGAIINMGGGNETILRGTRPQRIASCLATLDVILRQRTGTASSMVLADKFGTSRAAEESGGVLKGEKLLELVGRILGAGNLNELSNKNLSLADLGMDSLMGVEIKQILEKETDIILSIQEIRALTLDNLKNIQ